VACSIAALIATLAERTRASSIAALAGQAEGNIPAGNTGGNWHREVRLAQTHGNDDRSLGSG